jgi:hypothetical protein
MTDPLVVNGIDGTSGAYLLPALAPHDIAAAAIGEPRDPEQVKELGRWLRRLREETLGPKEGIDPKERHRSQGSRGDRLGRDLRARCRTGDP